MGKAVDRVEASSCVVTAREPLAIDKGTSDGESAAGGWPLQQLVCQQWGWGGVAGAQALPFCHACLV